MSKRTPQSFTDQNYLLETQYSDDARLRARMRLHLEFSTNTYPWHRWVFDQIQAPANARVLELGCGPGAFWETNADVIPSNWSITLSDLSPGMVEQARKNLFSIAGNFRFEEIDAQEIPFTAESLDVVIANHMLYHVPDRDRALQEIWRVLVPGASLYAATNGRRHMFELRRLTQDFSPDGGSNWDGIGDLGFTLEAGAEQLSRFFSTVKCVLYEDAMEVTAVEPLIAYMMSTETEPWPAEHLATLQAHLSAHIEREGAFHIGKSTGFFIATK